MIKIDKGVPLPTPRAGFTRYPWREMGIGDSFFVADYDGLTTHRVQSQATWRQRHAGAGKFTTRREANGLRVWRVA